MENQNFSSKRRRSHLRVKHVRTRTAGREPNPSSREGGTPIEIDRGSTRRRQEIPGRSRCCRRWLGPDYGSRDEGSEQNPLIADMTTPTTPVTPSKVWPEVATLSQAEERKKKKRCFLQENQRSEFHFIEPHRKSG